MTLYQGDAEAPRPRRRHACAQARATGLLSKTLFALLALGGAPLVGCAPYGNPVDAVGGSLGNGANDPLDDEGDTGEDGDDTDTNVGGAQGTRVDSHSLSNEKILEILRNHDYRGPDFSLINPEPFPSTVAPGKTISLWVSNQGKDALSTIIPEASGSEAEVPVGTMVVREVLNGSVLETITVMVKLPKGSFPLGGDYWYAATDADGNVKQTADGMPVAGLLEDCGTCHLRRSHDAYIFGTPRAYLPQQ